MTLAVKVALKPQYNQKHRVGEALNQIRTQSVRDLQLRHGKRGIRVILHFLPISH